MANRILIAFDKFKGTLTAAEACEAAARGLSKALPGVSLTLCPIADGGEGTVESLAVTLPRARRQTALVWNAMKSRRVGATYLLNTEDEETTAYIEMASASGLALIGPDERDPLKASTFGTGELIQHAMDQGAGNIVIGLGGSATNDGGVGLAQALGFRFLDSTGGLLEDLPRRLCDLERIEFPRELPRVQVRVLCDVQNPLLGPAGATRVYGPQKGVTQETAPLLEAGLARLAEVVERDFGISYRDVPGSGAAGGCAWGLMSFLGGQLVPGFEFIARLTRLPEAVRRSDCVITGEGRLDLQTLNGKAPMGVAEIAREEGKRVIAIGGAIDADALPRLNEIFDEVIELVGGDVTEERAIADAAAVLEARCFALQAVWGRL